MAFTDNLIAAIERAGLNQTTLAARLGVTPAAVNQWCAGETMPKPKRLEEIASALGIDLPALLGGDVAPLSGRTSAPAATAAVQSVQPPRDFAKDEKERIWLDVWRKLPKHVKPAVLASLLATLPADAEDGP